MFYIKYNPIKKYHYKEITQNKKVLIKKDLVITSI